MSRIFGFDDWLSPQHFCKQFLSGAFIAIVMTGLDQDMMQKNLTCKTLRDAQKDMCSYGVAFVPANMLFLALGILLTMVLGTDIKGDALLPTYVQGTADAMHPSLLTLHLFILGIVAASFSSADSALTSLTTCYCVDIRRQPDNVALRKRTHIAMCLFFMLFIHPVPPAELHLPHRRHLHTCQLHLRPTARTVYLRTVHNETARRPSCALHLPGITPRVFPAQHGGTTPLGLPFRLRTADVQRLADLPWAVPHRQKIKKAKSFIFHLLSLIFFLPLHPKFH